MSMQNIQSWSAFEQCEQHPSTAAGGEAHEDLKTSVNVADALYVSPSSTNIAQSAAALLRQAGLSGGDNSEHEEFKLKFHWMRPHPSLILEIEDQLKQQDVSSENVTEDDVGTQEQYKKKHQSRQRRSNAPSPAIEASRLMKAHRYAQLSKVLRSKPNEGNRAHDAETQLSLDEVKARSHSLQNQTMKADDPATEQCYPLDLPLEMPQLRINLANLVGPPLMSSWLPGEDTWD